MVSHACYVSNVVRPSEENIDKKFVYDMKPILSKISVNDSYSHFWDGRSYKIGESYYLRYNEEDIFIVDRSNEKRSDITTIELLDVLNREHGSNYTIQGFELRDKLLLHIDMDKGTYIYERESTKWEPYDDNYLNVLASNQCVDRKS